MSAEEAIARAKAIAARLAGTGASAAIDPSPAPLNVNAVADAALAAAFGQSPSSSSSSAPKRKRWSDDGGGSTSTEDALAQAMSKRPNLSSSSGGSSSGAGSYSKKLMIPVDKYPGYNFIGLLIGPGGSKQRELVAQSGGNVKISIRGKGSSSSNANPSQSEEPLHVLLEGQMDNVLNAERLISVLLNDPEKAQAEKDRQLALVGNGSGGGGGGGTSTYTPKPVAHLIGLNGGGHYGPAAGDQVIEEKIGIPNGFVGYIIGKGGESITSMQRKSGCKVQIQKEHEMEPGTTQRIITLTAATPEAVSMCRGVIEDMVQERARLNEENRNGGGFGGGPGPGSNAAGQAAQLQAALSQGQEHVTVQVPNSDVGLVIGKGGMTIRSIQERSGANVQIPQGPDHNNPSVRTVNITHPNQEGAEFAKTLIEEVLATKMNNGGGGGSYGAAGGISVQVQVSTLVVT
jgi:far upstream element-binding protein